jgi:signal transduction histidine kinase
MMGLNQNLAVNILNSIPTGISITTDIFCKEIRHNRTAAKFLRVELWDKLLHTASEDQPVKLFHKGEELSPGEMPIKKQKRLYVSRKRGFIKYSIADLILDEKEIRQLILNLVRNGLEAISPGGVIRIRTFSEEDEVVLSVQDNGKGINPDVLEKLGTPFFTTKDTGTGLGLAVCYSIAARHNARIDIETGPEGTTFFVKFKKPA